jgi:hypothetical protein
MAAQACYQKALLFQQRHEEMGLPLEHCYLFHYEAGYDEMLRRLWSHAARIHKDELEQFSWGKLSRRGHLKPYEAALFAERARLRGAEQVDGEYERLQAAFARLRVNVHLHDFSGSDGNPAVGAGYVEEIAAALRREVDVKGRKVGAVYVDYVLLAARRHLQLHNRKTDDLRHYVGGFPDAVFRQVAGPFDCRVYLFHQMSAASNARSFGARFRSADGAESKGFAENLWFAFELGVPDRETGCVELFCDKARRARGRETPLLLRMRGEFNTFERAADMAVNPSTGRPVSREELAVVASLPPPRDAYAPADDPFDLDLYEP